MELVVNRVKITRIKHYLIKILIKNLKDVFLYIFHIESMHKENFAKLFWVFFLNLCELKRYEVEHINCVIKC